MKKILITFLFILLANACSSQPIKIESEPAGADVLISHPGQVPKKIGVTPLISSSSDLDDRRQSTTLTFEKLGYRTESVVLPAAALGRTGEVRTVMKVNEQPPVCPNPDEVIGKVARGIAEVQSLIRQKNLSGAEQRLTFLSSQFPRISVIYDLLGNVFYLKRDMGNALTAYKKSLELAPDNIETGNMIKKLNEYKGDQR